MFNIKTTSPPLGIISLQSLKKVFRDSRCSEIFAASVLKPVVAISEFNFCCIYIYAPLNWRNLKLPRVWYTQLFSLNDWALCYLKTPFQLARVPQVQQRKQIQLFFQKGNDFRLQKKCKEINHFEACSEYVEIKCQLDATEVFIADLIACSTCFGDHYAHQLRVMCPVCRMLPHR